jgi:pimeloyl-ACP methyl ester carboxylesterase
MMPTGSLPGLLPRLFSAVLIAVGMGAAGCASHSPTAKPPSPTASSAPASSWVEDAVSFSVADMTVYGTFRHPAGHGRAVPGALLIAGSGPTDRNGDSAAMPGQVDTLRNLARALSDDGVASLRYDKLGTGQTGLGPYATDPTKVDISVFQDEATAALNFLAGQSGIDRTHVMALGHSEGALYAMMLATAAPGTAPAVQTLGLLEPASRRILDHVSEQAHAQADAAVRSGRVTAARAAESTAAFDNAIQEFRATGQVPPDEPPGLKSVINATNAHALLQEDAIDPVALAAKLPRDMPVLVTCSDADLQITCQDVDSLVSGLTSAGTKTDYVHLTGVDHVLKEDASRTPANYTKPLPFSTQLAAALASFIKESGTTP